MGHIIGCHGTIACCFTEKSFKKTFHVKSGCLFSAKFFLQTFLTDGESKILLNFFFQTLLTDIESNALLQVFAIKQKKREGDGKLSLFCYCNKNGILLLI